MWLLCDEDKSQLQLAIKFPGGTGFWSRWVTSLMLDKSNVCVIIEKTDTVLHLCFFLSFSPELNE